MQKIPTTTTTVGYVFSRENSFYGFIRIGLSTAITTTATITITTTTTTTTTTIVTIPTLKQ